MIQTNVQFRHRPCEGFWSSCPCRCEPRLFTCLLYSWWTLVTRYCRDTFPSRQSKRIWLLRTRSSHTLPHRLSEHTPKGVYKRIHFYEEELHQATVEYVFDQALSWGQSSFHLFRLRIMRLGKSDTPFCHEKSKTVADYTSRLQNKRWWR